MNDNSKAERKRAEIMAAIESKATPDGKFALALTGGNRIVVEEMIGGSHRFPDVKTAQALIREFGIRDLYLYYFNGDKNDKLQNRRR